MKVFNYVMGGLFIISAALQFNDPDPYLWITIYGVAALLAYMNIVNKHDRLSHLGMLLACLIYGFTLVFKKDGVISWFNDHQAESLVQSMKATKPWIENAREFGGLMIIAVFLVINLILEKRKTSIS
jgi:glucan phosphoethanolaminetransferase (alkaline phosphatase superfamily)